MQYIVLWVIGAVSYFLISSRSADTVTEIIAPVVFCLFTVWALKFTDYRQIAYVLFFTIAFTSLFGFTETLTGSPVQSTQPLLFGLSFYTASLAYLLFNKPKLASIDGFKISNPLLLATGPIALFITDFRYRSIGRRFNYFFPFVIVGVFYYQIIAIPLTETFTLIESTDLVSSVLFAIIFELFVYANFCGLSLVIYGVLGILGFKIPLNFRQPFSSSNLIEFWRGWHASLSVVLKSLFYAPLRKKYSSSIALLGVFLASAMWHGVTLNFVLWGLFHALMFILTIQLLKQRVKYLPFIVLLIAIVIGRMLFADSQADRLIEKLMFSYKGFGVIETLMALPNTSKVSLMLGFVLIAIEFFFRKSKMVSKRNYKHLRSPMVLFLLVAIGITFASEVGLGFAVYGQR